MNNDWIDIELLEDYLDGKLDSKAMHQLEKQALEDPFIAQALAGLSESPKRASQSISILQKQLYERVAQQQVTKKDTIFTWQRLSVAAAAAVMFVSVSIIFFMREKENRDRLAKQPHKVEVNLAPKPGTETTPNTGTATGAGGAAGANADQNALAAAALDSAKKQLYASISAKEKTNIQSASPVVSGQTNPETARSAATIANNIGQVDPNKENQADRMVERQKDSVNVQGGALPGVPVAPVNKSIATVAPAASAPIGGWAKLDTYISDHNKLAASKPDKFVQLSFIIDNEGKPTDIRVEKGISKEFDDEAVRLIKEGPKWEQTKQTARITYTISF